MGNDTATGRQKGSPKQRAEAAARAKYRQTERGSAEQQRRWSEVDDLHPGILDDLVSAVTGAGDAVMLGRSRDGGALCAWVYSDGSRYGKCHGDPEDALAAILDFIADAKEASGEL